MTEQSRPHRPALHADLTDFIDAWGDDGGVSRAEIAAATAEVVVRAGRDSTGSQDRLVELADRVGIDTLAQLWQHSDPVSLPGALWALYLLRQWCRVNAEQVTLYWRAGEPLAPADAVVAGVADAADGESLHRVADDVLTGVYGRDLGVALERAAALFRVVAAGRRDLAGDGEPGDVERELADRNDRVAADLSAAAKLWRNGQLH